VPWGMAGGKTLSCLKCWQTVDLQGVARVALLRSVMCRVFLETAMQKLIMEKVNFESAGGALNRWVGDWGSLTKWV